MTHETWYVVTAWNIEVVIINLLIILKSLERGRQVCCKAVPYESDAMLWKNHRWESIVMEAPILAISSTESKALSHRVATMSSK